MIREVSFSICLATVRFSLGEFNKLNTWFKEHGFSISGVCLQDKDLLVPRTKNKKTYMEIWNMPKVTNDKILSVSFGKRRSGLGFLPRERC